MYYPSSPLSAADYAVARADIARRADDWINEPDATPPPLALDNPDTFTEICSLLDAYADPESPPTTQYEVEILVDAYKRAKDGEDAAAHPWVQAQLRARALLNDCIAVTGITKWATAAGKAQITAPSVRVQYNAKAIDILCASDPDLAAKLRPHRTETHVDGGLRIS